VTRYDNFEQSCLQFFGPSDLVTLIQSQDQSKSMIYWSLDYVQPFHKIS